ncbi:hypothetical protein ACOMHN_049123 [Nucella lapillus]
MMSRDMDGTDVTCSVTNVVLTSQGEAPRTADVRLLVEYVPMVTLNTPRAEVREGGSVQWSCRARGQPPVMTGDVHWLHKDRRLPRDTLHWAGHTHSFC